MKKIQVGIIGHTGRLGKPLIEILERHPFAKIVCTESRTKGRWGNLDETDIVFMALPQGESKNYLFSLDGKRIIDLSPDHRLWNGWTYGLPEIFREEIKTARKIANPGCYATAVILGLLPLRGKIKKAYISAESGISGAGRQPSRGENIEVYHEGTAHYQLEEMIWILGARNIIFVPKRIHNMDRGIISTIFAEAKKGLGDLQKLYLEFFRRFPFTRIVCPKVNIETWRVLRTNYCDIKITPNPIVSVIISTLDNLIKGGAGQAVQNFNLMCGFPETTGLL
jgi:N-acetyl-gamma-glutamyl-phosphate reductase